MSESIAPAAETMAGPIERAERWFAERGWSPFDYQRQAWRAYLAGRSGLIHAPTGVGKTLAAWMGPLLDAIDHPPPAKGRSKEGAPPLQVLWITPLRALAHDTAENLRRPLETFAPDWAVELRTGDTSSSVKKRQRQRLPTALITTPESLSLLLSYADAVEKFRSLRCVVVDEWHELLGTKRGVQTELGLARLRTFCPALRTWGLSATMGNLEQARDVLLGEHPAKEDAELIHGGPDKEYAVQTLLPETVERFPWAGHLGTKLVEGVIDAIEGAKSTLLFTNTRSQAEIWFRELLRRRMDWVGAIALHHGSLEMRIRREVERMLREGGLKAVVCTSSLDLGVDFTPVDQVMQVGSPKGVARLMQRAGRSGHQPGAISRVVGVPTHALELIEFSAARQAIADRRIEPRVPLKRALDVLVQHLVTVAMGGGFDEAALLKEIRTTHAFAELTLQDWRWAMRFVTGGSPALLAYPEYARIKATRGRYAVAGDRIARMHRANIGTITSDSAIPVRYMNGRRLGTIEERFISRLSPGDRFIFAGRPLELIRVRNMVAYVKRVKSVRGSVPRWDGARFPLSTHLAELVRRRLSEAGDGRYEDEEMRTVAPLLGLQAEQSRLPGEGELLIETTESRDGQHHFLYPFQGRLVHEGLGALLAHRISRARPASITVNVNDYGIELLIAEPIDLTEDDWRGLLDDDRLVEDLLACVNQSAMARRQFRDIARIAGLIFQGYPGQSKTNRQIQASSDLFFDVFLDYDPENLLLDQARREVLEQQLEVRRMREALKRIAGMALAPVPTERLSPLAFPLYADRLRSQHVSTERWRQRIERMARQLEASTRPGE